MPIVIDYIKRILSNERRRDEEDGRHMEIPNNSDGTPFNLTKEALKYFEKNKAKLDERERRLLVQYFRGEGIYFFDRAWQSYYGAEEIMNQFGINNTEAKKLTSKALEFGIKSVHNLDAFFIVGQDEEDYTERWLKTSVKKVIRDSAVREEFPTLVLSDQYLAVRNDLEAVIKIRDKEAEKKIRDEDLPEFFKNVYCMTSGWVKGHLSSFARKIGVKYPSNERMEDDRKRKGGIE